MYIIRFPRYNFQEGTLSNITQSIYIFSFFPRAVFIRNNISVSGSMRPAPKSRKGLKKRQEAPVSVIAFNFFSACQNIASNSGITHHLDSLPQNLLGSFK